MALVSLYMQELMLWPLLAIGFNKEAGLFSETDQQRPFALAR